MEPYKQKDWLYERYVKRRKNLKDIVQELDDTYNIKISTQALYNWIKRYDLLKFRGKGRNLKANTRRNPGMKQKAKRPRSAAENRLKDQAARKRRRRR